MRKQKTEPTVPSNTYVLENKNANAVMDWPLSPEDLPYIRVTSVAEMEKCEKKWAATYLIGMGIEEPIQFTAENVPKKPSASQIGTAMHQICEDAAIIRRILANNDTSTMMPPMPHEHPALAWIPESERPNLMDALNREVTRIQTDGELELATEVTLQFEVPGLDMPPIKGHIDKLSTYYAQQDTVIITDYKSNRTGETAEEWKKKPQQMLYAAGVRIKMPQVKKIIWRIVYLNLGYDVEWVSEPEDDKEIFERVANVWNAITGKHKKRGDIEVFSETVHSGCSYCPLKNQCNSYKANTLEFVGAMQQLMPADKIEKLRKLKMVAKLVKNEIESVEAEIAEQINLTGKPFIGAGVAFELVQEEQRKASFADVWPQILELSSSVPGFDEEFFKFCDDIFTVKVGGLDKVSKHFGGLVAKHLATTVRKEAKSELTLKERKIK